MSKTLTSVADRVNQLLQNDYKDQDKLSVGVSAAATCQTLSIVEGRKYEPNDRLEIGTEVLYVIEAPKEIDFLNQGSTLAASVSAIKVTTSANWAANDYGRFDAEQFKVSKVSVIGTNNLKVTRGVRGTSATEHDKTVPMNKMNSIFVRRGYTGSTAAYHASAAVVYIVDGWTRFEIIENIKREMESLYPIVSRDFQGDMVGLAHRRQVFDADTVSLFTAEGEAITPTLNSSDQREGTSCLNLGSTYVAGAGATYLSSPTSFDMTNYEYLNIWFYLNKKFDSNKNPYVDEDALEIRIGPDEFNYKSIRVGRAELNEGKWTLLNLPLVEFSTIGESFLIANIQFIKITIFDKQSIPIGDIKIDEWYLSTFPVTTNKLKYRLPTGVRLVDEVRLFNELGTANVFNELGAANAFTYLRSYRIDEKYIYLSELPRRENMPMIIKGQKEFTIPTSNSTTLDIENDLEELLIVGAAIRCYEQKLAEVLRSDKYSARNGESYPLYLDREKRRITERYQELKRGLAKSSSGMADWKDYG